MKLAKVQAILRQVTRMAPKETGGPGQSGKRTPSPTFRSGAELEAALVGKFLLGMVSGGLLVTGGLVVGSMLFPTRPANDNAPVAEAIAAPAVTTPEAGETVKADDKADAAKVEAMDAPLPKLEEGAAPGVVPDTQPPAEPVAAPEANSEAAPVVAATDPAPEAPKAEAVVAEPAVPSVAEVEKPLTVAEPPKPAASDADVAATTPETTAPAMPEIAIAAAPETAVPEAMVAEAKPVATEPAAEAAVTATVEPVPAAPAAPDPAAVEMAPVELAPVELAQNDPAPAAEPSAATPEGGAVPATEAAPAVTEPASETPAVQAPAEPAPAAEPAPEIAPDVIIEPPVAEAPAAEVPAAEVPAAEAPAEEVPAETSPVAPEVEAVPGAAVPAMPGSRPAALPGTTAPAEPEQPVILTEEAGKSPTFKPAPGLIRSGEGVIIKRGTDNATEPAPADGSTPVDPRPIAQFAATFDNPDAKPAFAIVLVDDGSPDLDRAGLAALPFPVSFALDPLDPATPERAAIYRAAGREVVMMVTGIATGAQASDVEVAFQSMEQGLPEAVAVMDLVDPTFQNNRGLAAAVIPILKAGGRGLLTWDEGLNAADQVARREDLEAAVLFRDLDQAGGDPVAVRRLLDRAVFKAGQDGQASVVGKADPATVAALLEWTVEGKAATVALAPVTAVLKVD